MQKNQSRLTVFFDDSFWVCVYERASAGRLEACKITFGAEPKDYEVYHFLLQHWHRLRFSPPVKAEMPMDGHINPKRMQRAIKKQLQAHGVGTKAQQALKSQYEESKSLHKQHRKNKATEEKQRLFELKQQKRREKHRGR